MSLFQMRVKCNVCGKKYDFNPDTGMILCPYCSKVKAPIIGKPIIDNKTFDSRIIKK